MGQLPKVEDAEIEVLAWPANRERVPRLGPARSVQTIVASNRRLRVFVCFMVDIPAAVFKQVSFMRLLIQSPEASNRDVKFPL